MRQAITNGVQRLSVVIFTSHILLGFQPIGVAQEGPIRLARIKAPIGTVRRVIIDTLKGGPYVLDGEFRSEPPSPRRILTFTTTSGEICMLLLSGERTETTISELSACTITAEAPFQDVLEQVRHRSETFSGVPPLLAGADQPPASDEHGTWLRVTDEGEPFHRGTGRLNL